MLVLLLVHGIFVRFERKLFLPFNFSFAVVSLLFQEMMLVGLVEYRVGFV